MAEEWRAVLGWEDLYEVSNCGRVRSKPRMYEKRWRGSLFNRVYGGQCLKPIKKKATGYLCVTLHDKGRKVQEGIHRLVLDAFIGPAPEGYQACHNNAQRGDNRLINLRWGSVAENQADKVAHGNSLRGEKNLRAKLTEDQVRYIKASPETQTALARRFLVSQVLISKIRRGKVWAHVQ